MPSHLDTKTVRPSNVTDIDVKGNCHADKLAGDIARQLCVPLNVSAPVLYYHQLAKRIQHRLATILIHLPSRNKNKLYKQSIPRQHLSTAIAESNHIMHEERGRIRCARCRRSYHLGDPKVKAWLAASCPGIGADHDKPVPLKHDSIHLGRNNSHPHTHNIYIFKGLIYCNTCGARGISHFNKLSHPCDPPSDFGLATLKAINSGRLPPNVTHWPDEAVLSRQAPTRRRGVPTPPPRPAKGLRTNPPLGGAFACSVPPPPLPSPTLPQPLPLHPQQVFLDNLQDLLDLQDAAESVIWPEGFNTLIARQSISLGQLPPAPISTVGTPPTPLASNFPELLEGNTASSSLHPREGVSPPASSVPIAKPKFVVTPRVRRFVTHREYDKLKEARRAEPAYSSSCAHSVPPTSTFDDPDLSMSEDQSDPGP